MIVRIITALTFPVVLLNSCADSKSQNPELTVSQWETAFMQCRESNSLICYEIWSPNQIIATEVSSAVEESGLRFVWDGGLGYYHLEALPQDKKALSEIFDPLIRKYPKNIWLSE